MHPNQQNTFFLGIRFLRSSSNGPEIAIAQVELEEMILVHAHVLAILGVVTKISNKNSGFGILNIKNTITK